MLIDIDVVTYALQHCAADHPCGGCPYYDKGCDCQEILMMDAHQIIKTIVEPRIQAIMNSEEE